MSPIFKRAILSLAEQSMERVHSLDHWPSILLQIKTKSQKKTEYSEFDEAAALGTAYLTGMNSCVMQVK
jgi:hypothetical protein